MLFLLCDEKGGFSMKIMEVEEIIEIIIKSHQIQLEFHQLN